MRATSEMPQIEQQIQQLENAIEPLAGRESRTHRPHRPACADRRRRRTSYRIAFAVARATAGHPGGGGDAHRRQRADRRRSCAVLSQPYHQRFGRRGGRQLSKIFATSGKTIYGIGSLTQPLFAGGRLRGQLELSEQAKQEMVLNYQKTIAQAFRDVSNALIALKKQRANREEQEKLVAAAEDPSALRGSGTRAGRPVISRCLPPTPISLPRS